MPASRLFARSALERLQWPRTALTALCGSHVELGETHIIPQPGVFPELAEWTMLCASANAR